MDPSTTPITHGSVRLRHVSHRYDHACWFPSLFGVPGLYLSFCFVTFDVLASLVHIENLAAGYNSVRHLCIDVLGTHQPFRYRILGIPRSGYRAQLVPESAVTIPGMQRLHRFLLMAFPL